MRVGSEHNSGAVKVVLAAAAGNLAIAVAKFAGAMITGSSAMFSEGVHSLVDTGNQALMLFGFRRSRRPPSARHPFGHGREIYFYAFVVAVLLFSLGAGVSAYEGVHKLAAPEPIRLPWVNYAVLTFGILMEGGAWSVAYREFNRTRPKGQSLLRAVRESKDPSVFVVLFEDTAAILGLLVALAGVAGAHLTGIVALDALASLAIALILAVTAVFLAIETKGLLIGEAARPDVQARIREALGRSPFAEERLLTVHFGPNDILVAAEVSAPDDWTAERLEKAVRLLEDDIRRGTPQATSIFIETVRRGSGPQARKAPAARSKNQSAAGSPSA